MQRLALDLGVTHWTVLLRAHKLDAVRRAPRRPVRAVSDVSAYPDNRELYLAADVLVTDYSSVMFDFAVTGKPMLFFTLDLARVPRQRARLLLRLRGRGPGPAARPRSTR